MTTIDIKFNEPAIYQIKVMGNLSEVWSDRLGGMQITVEPDADMEPTVTLLGWIKDQAALSGVLNTLFELHLTILSVQVIPTPET